MDFFVLLTRSLNDRVLGKIAVEDCSFNPKDKLLALINPEHSFFLQLSLRFSNELTKIGHFQSSKSFFEVK